MNPASMRALVTGGGGGIGGAIADELLARGAAVLLVDRDEAALRRAAERLSRYGDRVGTLAADLTSAADRAAALPPRRAAWRGGINVLVNNAGVNHFSMFADQPPEQLDLAVAINLLAPMHLCRELLPHLLRQPEACILNTGSVFGAIGYPGYAVYSATKFARARLHRGAAPRAGRHQRQRALRRAARDPHRHQHLGGRAHERRARRGDGSAGAGREGRLRHAGRRHGRGRARLAREAVRARQRHPAARRGRRAAQAAARDPSLRRRVRRAVTKP